MASDITIQCFYLPFNEKKKVLWDCLWREGCQFILVSYSGTAPWSNLSILPGTLHSLITLSVKEGKRTRIENVFAECAIMIDHLAAWLTSHEATPRVWLTELLSDWLPTRLLASSTQLLTDWVTGQPIACYVSAKLYSKTAPSSSSSSLKK